MHFVRTFINVISTSTPVPDSRPCTRTRVHVWTSPARYVAWRSRWQVRGGRWLWRSSPSASFPCSHWRCWPVEAGAHPSAGSLLPPHPGHYPTCYWASSLVGLVTGNIQCGWSLWERKYNVLIYTHAHAHTHRHTGFSGHSEICNIIKVSNMYAWRSSVH